MFYYSTRLIIISRLLNDKINSKSTTQQNEFPGFFFYYINDDGFYANIKYQKKLIVKAHTQLHDWGGAFLRDVHDTHIKLT